MKILVFSTAYLPLVGGAELAIKEITDRLPDISFTLITGRFRRTALRFERIGNVGVYRVGFGASFDKWLLPFSGFALAKKLEKQHEFNVLWSMMASQASIAAARFKKAFPEKRLILTLQEGDEEEHLKRYVGGSDLLYRLLIRPWHALAFRRADAITAISMHLAERAQRNNGNVPIYVIPNGVNVKRFMIYDLGFRNQEKEKIRQKLGVRPEDKIIITTSRLVPKNGMADLIESLRYLPDEIKLLICGEGPLWSSLELIAKRYALQARVKFVGLVPHAKLPHYLWTSDIFCRPSLSEGMGSSFVEAMAAGLPVLATPVGGIPDVVHAPPLNFGMAKLFSNSETFGKNFESWHSRITGLFCEVGNPKSIAEKIQLLLSDNSLRGKIVENALKMVKENYDWEKIARRMQEVFNSLNA